MDIVKNETVSLKNRLENLTDTIRHDIQISAIEQTHALQLLLNGQFGSFSAEQKEFLELIFYSCIHLRNTVKQILAVEDTRMRENF